MHSTASADSMDGTTTPSTQLPVCIYIASAPNIFTRIASDNSDWTTAMTPAAPVTLPRSVWEITWMLQAYFVFFSATAARSPSARSSRVNSLNRRS